MAQLLENNERVYCLTKFKIMKTLKIVIAALFLFAASGTRAQVSVDVHFGAPAWAPAAPANVQYYYLPDIGVYYDAGVHQYIYPSSGAWVRTAVLPGRYRGYDLRSSHPVYLTEYRGNAPYVYYKEHKVKYRGNGWKRNGHDGHDNGNHGNRENHGGKGHH